MHRMRDTLKRMNRGPMLMILATLVLTAMSASVKVARTELDTLDIVLWRSIFAIPLAWWWVRRTPLHIQRKGLLAVRITLGFLAIFRILRQANIDHKPPLLPIKILSRARIYTLLIRS